MVPVSSTTSPMRMRPVAPSHPGNDVHCNGSGHEHLPLQYAQRPVVLSSLMGTLASSAFARVGSQLNSSVTEFCHSHVSVSNEHARLSALSCVALFMSALHDGNFCLTVRRV